MEQLVNRSITCLILVIIESSNSGNDVVETMSSGDHKQPATNPSMECNRSLEWNAQEPGRRTVLGSGNGYPQRIGCSQVPNT